VEFSKLIVFGIVNVTVRVAPVDMAVAGVKIVGPAAAVAGWSKTLTALGLIPSEGKPLPVT
jgi:hypothetical protein